MKKILLFTLASTSIIAAYLFAKKYVCASCSEEEHAELKPKRHLTNAFSKAKQHSTS